MEKVVCLGEVMLRLAPTGYDRLLQNENMIGRFGGAEANVAVSLSNLNMDVIYATKLPDNPIGDACINNLKSYNIDTKYIKKGGDRIGIYYTEKGAAMRPGVCIYDRKHSSISEASIDDFNFDDMYKDASWLHITGITPSLSDNMAKVTEKAMEYAKKKNMTVSFDINYRSKLWELKKAKDVLDKLCKYVDICIVNEEDMRLIFDEDVKADDNNDGKLNVDSYIKSCENLCKKYNFSKVAVTIRKSYSASFNSFSGILYDKKDGKAYISKVYDIEIIDRIGSGDSFAAGIIYGSLNNFDNQKTVEYAAALGALKHTIEGDYNLVDIKELEKTVSGDISGRIQR